MPAESTIRDVWIWSLVAYFAVVGVVALMLTLILAAVRRIHDGAAEIWTVGQKVANNTIQIALLQRTNHLAGRIRDAALVTAGAVDAIERHAASCSGCPACVLGTRRGGGLT